jgi:hypothetical protein
MCRTGFLVLVLVLVLATSTAVAQQPSSLIRGRVVAAENERPLRRAFVSLSGVSGARPVLTDEDGRFEITGGMPSSQLLIAKAGYITTTFVPARESTAHEIRVARGGVIAGRVIDPRGNPAVGARVRAALASAPGSVASITETDDLGDFRIAGLAPGRYAVTAMVQWPGVLTVADLERIRVMAQPGRSLAATLAEGRSGESAVVDVRSGDETSGVDLRVSSSDVNLRVDTSDDSSALDFRIAGGRDVAAALERAMKAHVDANTGPGGAAMRGGIGTRQMSFRVGPPVPTGWGPDTTPPPPLMTASGGAITGVVADSAGEPLQGVRIRALQVRRENGQTIARLATVRTTDDRGRYRVFGLPTGSYLVTATLEASEFRSDAPRAMTFAPVFYPGTSLVDAAQPVAVEAGNDVTGADLTMTASPVVRVVGRALNADGAPLVGRVSLAVSQRSGAISPDPQSAPINADGTFEFSDVGPGNYVVQALGEAHPGQPAQRGAEFVTVADQDPEPLTITASAGATLEGRFLVEGLAEPPTRALGIHAFTLDRDRGPAAGRGPDGLWVFDDGRFSLTGLYGPVKFTYRNPVPGYYLKSVTIGGVDVTDTGFDFGFSGRAFDDAEIVLSPAGGGIAGTVTGRAGARADQAIVLAFSTNRQDWFAGSRFLKLVAATNGSFDLNGLPPGEYWAAAVDALAPGDWQTPEVLDGLVGTATRVTIAERQVQTATLRLTRP